MGQKVGCARSKRQCLMVPQNLKLLLWMLVLRMDGIPALDLWDVVIGVLHSSKNTHQAVRDHCRKEKVDDQVQGNLVRGEIWSTNPKTKFKRSGNRDVDELSNVDHVNTNASSSQFQAQLYIFGDNEAVIKFYIKGRRTKSNDETRIQNPQSCF